VKPFTLGAITIMAKQLLGVIVIDFFVSLIYINWLNPDSSGDIVAFFVCLFLFGLNLVFAIIFKLLHKKSAIVFLINSIVSIVVFYLFWNISLSNIRAEIADEYNFEKADLNYRVSLEKRDRTLRNGLRFEIFELSDRSSTLKISGSYYISNNGVLLKSNSGKVNKMTTAYIFDFPNIGDSALLHRH
jgi:hypothetical protein